MRGALGAGHHIVGFGRKTHVVQVLGDLVGTAGRIVGDEQRTSTNGSERFDGAAGGFMAAEDRAIEVDEKAVMFLRKRAQVRPTR